MDNFGQKFTIPKSPPSNNLVGLQKPGPKRDNDSFLFIASIVIHMVKQGKTEPFVLIWFYDKRGDMLVHFTVIIWTEANLPAFHMAWWIMDLVGQKLHIHGFVNSSQSLNWASIISIKMSKHHYVFYYNQISIVTVYFITFIQQISFSNWKNTIILVIT